MSYSKLSEIVGAVGAVGAGLRGRTEKIIIHRLYRVTHNYNKYSYFY